MKTGQHRTSPGKKNPADAGFLYFLERPQHVIHFITVNVRFNCKR